MPSQGWENREIDFLPFFSERILPKFMGEKSKISGKFLDKLIFFQDYRVHLHPSVDMSPGSEKKFSWTLKK